MKLAISLQDKLGVSQKVLTAIASHGWNVIAMEVETGLIYLDIEGQQTSLTDVTSALSQLPEFITCHQIDVMPSALKEQHLQALLARISEPILDIDKHGVVITANQAAVKLFGSKNRSTAILGSQINSLINLTSKDIQGQSRRSISITVKQMNFIADITSVYSEQDYQGAVIMLRETRALGRQISALQNTKPLDDGIAAIISQSAQMQQVKEQAMRFAALDLPVLLRGETGTGKELLARAIHQSSARNQQPFLAINCATLPEHLLESELFGYQAGAFTGASKAGKPGLLELAEGGTIFLDEIAEMSVYLQAKLLRFLENYQFRRVGGTQELNANVRIISATHQDLESNIEQQAFREDLYYRLNVLSIQIPPLRQRLDDLALLIPHFLKLAAQQVDLIQPSLSDDAYQQLASYQWPGNIRQLQNSLFRIVALAKSSVITQADIIQVLNEFSHTMQGNNAKRGETEHAGSDYRNCQNWQEAQDLFEHTLLSQLYPQFHSTRALAKRLGVSHNKIAMKLRQHKLS
ncbi:sigma 54-interacting transcriptional regulator [Thalassotalea sp. LPB0316]|uniref:sigma 54-interacting transcriptional regulator n=1 Tax=Thalassotalea sp. LPB0316 TaxID=2769490 RepID=UPI001866537A|nr:sigma 54-interacting transcriptional regulator [Thalassotalea sp. LPB0316]QOL25326.1 sigma 54-interacting transcriptional regulator [Thalassotalea sp. LPB0316]